MKKIVSALILCFVLVFTGCGGSAGWDAVNEDYKFENIQNQINASNVKIDELIAQVNALAEAVNGQVTQAQIDVLQKQINELVAQMDALKVQAGLDNAALNAEIASLAERIKNLEKTVAILQAKVDGQTIQITELIAQINVLNEQVADLLARIAVLEAKCECDENDHVWRGEGDPKEDGKCKDGDFYYDSKKDYKGKHNVWERRVGKWCFDRQAD